MKHTPTTFVKAILLIATVTLLSNCASSKEIGDWRRPNSQDVSLNKVLVLGLTEDEDVRRIFETTLTNSLSKKGIQAGRSIDILESGYSDMPQNMEQLQALEQDLIKADFDAVLVTKVIGIDEKNSTSSIVRNYSSLFETFKEDVIAHNNNYRKNDTEIKNFLIYHVSSVLYCICDVEEESNIVWRYTIDIKQPQDANNLVEDGVQTFTRKFVKALQAQDLFD